MATASKILRRWTPASPTTTPGRPYIAVAQTSPRRMPTWSGCLFGSFGERLEPAIWPADFGIWNSSAPGKLVCGYLPILAEKTGGPDAIDADVQEITVHHKTVWESSAGKE